MVFFSFYILYFVASWVIAKQTRTTPNFKEFIDFEDSDQSVGPQVDFKRNLILEKKQGNDVNTRMFPVKSLSVEINVVSHLTKNKV